jgi:hypothetical protein
MMANLSVALSPADGPLCYIEGEIVSADFKEEYRDPCLDEEDRCMGTDSSHPPKYILGILIDSASHI